jgi:hypothetical protein
MVMLLFYAFCTGTGLLGSPVIHNP